MQTYPKTDARFSTVPLFRDCYGDAKFVSSGNLLNLNGSHILTTTAHSIDREDGMGHRLLVGGATPSFTLERPFMVTQLKQGQRRDDDPVDFAACVLTEDEASRLEVRCDFITYDQLEAVGATAQVNDFKLIGFPGNDNCCSPTKRTLSANALHVPTFLHPSFQDEKVKENPCWYVPVYYDCDELESEDRKDFNVPVKVNGFSGGALWRCKNADPCVFMGMPIAQFAEQKCILCLSFSAILDLLSNWWEKLHAASEEG